MSETKQTLEEALFELAAEKATAAERAEFLDGVCRDNAALRARLDVLLEGHFAGAGFLTQAPERAAPATLEAAPEVEAPAQMIGRYKLLEKLGEGGFGEVWMAEQREPVKRRVALKIIKLGMDSRQMVARFEAERQALAMMDHPNIAKVFDGGVTGDGPRLSPAAARSSAHAREIAAGPPPLHEHAAAEDSRGPGASVSPRPSDGRGAGGEGVLQSQIANRKSEISQGRPYFVMELVRGIKITDYCDQNQLPTRERLGLFIKVCQAIQHAHQKGIIHRDIKPSNILVTLHDGVPVPKVIDFGIAKATQQELTDKTVFTQFQQFIGTPAYISPEQAGMSGLDIDTRADIYSLGVLLYELLTGTTPFDAQELLKAGFDEMRRIIRETEPEKPSTRLTRVVAGVPPAVEGGILPPGLDRESSRALEPATPVPRGETPGSTAGGTPAATSTALLRRCSAKDLIHQLRGDLDWIVMKCLEKDRARRYETANGLAADIQRHLGNEPVVARPPSAAYRFQKMVRRNKVTCAAGSAVMAALLFGLSLAVWQSIERTRAYRRALAAEQAENLLRQQAEASARSARDEAAKSQQVSRFLKDMLRGVRPSVARGRDTAMLREILDQTTRRLGNSLKERPEVQAEILGTLAHSHEDLGLVDEAEKLYRESLRLYESVHGRGHPAVAGALVDLSSVLNHASQAGESEVLNREALAIYRKHYGSNSLATVPALINIALARGRRDDSANEEAFYREAIALYDRQPGQEDADLAFALYNLSACRHNERDYAQGASLAERSAAIYRSLPDHASDVANAVQSAGQSYYRRRDYAQAEVCFRESLAIRRTHDGVVSERTLDALTWLSLTLAAKEAKEEGVALVRETVIAERQLWASQPDKLSQALAGDADLLARFGQFHEAVSLYRERVQHLLERLPADHPDVLKARKKLAEFEQRLKTEKQTAGADP